MFRTINSDLNNILFKSVTQSVDDLAEAIIEQLLVDERFKKIFKQPRDNDQRKERRLLSRQKNKEQQYLLLEDLVAQDNKGLASSIKADQFAKEYLQVVDILYRELEAEYDDFPVDVRPLFRHFYIWTSKRIEVRNTTNNKMRLMR